MIRIAICDDKKTVIKAVKDLVYDTSLKLRRQIEVDTYDNGGKLINVLLNKNEPFDILILDIDMPEITGLELAEKLRAEGNKLIIIFLSAHEEFVFSAIEYNPFRYIRKNFMEAELPIALQAAFRVIETNPNKNIILKTDEGDIRLPLPEILYYEVLGRKIVVCTKNDQKIIVRKTIKEMRELIPEEYFIALHRSCVVNANYIKSIGECSVTLKNGQKLAISRARVKGVRKEMMNIWGGLI